MASAREINILLTAKDLTGGAFKSVRDHLSGITKLAGGAALGGIAALGGGMAAAAVGGFKLNSTMENVGLQLQALAGGSGQAAAIMDKLKAVAQDTEFGLSDLGQAAIGLVPAARQSGQSFDELLKTAQLLSASNPMEGLEGASFALREAVSGDFTSVIERFNLSRDSLNKLKAQGVPAIDAINQELARLGITQDLIDKRSQSIGVRFGKVTEQLGFLAATATKPIFDQVSAGLGTLGDFLSANEPKLTAFAETLGTRVGDAATQASGFITSTVIPALKQIGEFITGTAIPALQRFADWFSANGMPVIQSFAELVKTVFGGIASFLREHGDTIKSVLQGAWDTIKGVVEGALHVIEGIIKTVTAVMKGDWQGAWDGIKETVSGAKGVIVSLITGLKDAIVGIFAGAGAWLWNAGKNLIQGLINGISQKWGAAVGIARQLGSTILDAVSGIFREGSPSKEMFDKGVNFVLGFINAVRTMEPDAVKAVSDVAKSVTDAFSSVLDFATKAGKAGSLPSGINELISSLKFLAEHAVQSLGDTGRFIGTELLDAAKAAGDAVNSVMGALGVTLKFVIDGAEALDKGIDTGDGKWRELVSSLKFLAEHATQSLADTARYLGTETLDAAKQAGEAMGAPFGVLTAALDFVDRAAESVSLKAGVTFGEPLIQVLVGMATMATQAMSEAATRFSTETLDAAKQASASMGAPFSVLGAALDFVDKATQALKDNEWPFISQQFIDLLVDIAVRTTQALAEAGKRFDGEVLAAAKTFAEASKPVFDTIRMVADSFKSITEVGQVTEEHTGRFLGNLGRVMGMVKQMRSMALAGVTDALAYQDLMRQIVAALGAGTALIGSTSNPDVISNGAGNALIPMAHGGIVTRPTPILAGDGGEPEAIIPLSRLGRFGVGADQPIVINVTVQSILDGRLVGESVTPVVLNRIGQELVFQGARR